MRPSLAHFLGWAHHALGDVAAAAEAFLGAVRRDPGEARSWLHLGDCLSARYDAAGAALALGNARDAAVAAGDAATARDARAKLVKTKAWICDWARFDDDVARVAREAARTANSSAPSVEALGVAQVAALLPAATLRDLSRAQAFAAPPAASRTGAAPRRKTRDTIRVGFVSADFGVHPVSASLRGALLALDARDDVEVYCFALATTDSWWRRNASGALGARFVDVGGSSPAEAAALFLERGLDVVLDLHGHTLGSGLPLLGDPALARVLKLSFLGWPQTTGADFIDGLVADGAAARVEAAGDEFVEPLLVLGGATSYLPADHANLVGSCRARPRATAADAGSASRAPFSFGVVSNFQKMDPDIFTVWANALRRSDGDAVLRLLRYKLHVHAVPLLKAELAARGVHPSRLEALDLQPWIDHHWTKSQFDVVLDTTAKTGHTVVQDALWAGAPVVSLAGSRMEARYGASALRAARLEGLTEAFSLKDYEDLADGLRKRPRARAALRKAQDARLRKAPLFDTERWAAHFAAALAANVEAFGAAGRRHVVAPDTRADRAFPLRDVDADDGGVVLLHVGGRARKPGWRIVDVAPGPHVDVVAPMHALKGFENNSVAALYASHVLEHATLGARGSPLAATLAEWHRVLKPGGALLLAVPDLGALATFFAAGDLSLEEKAALTRVLFGGQSHDADYHHVAFDFELLAATLNGAGFCGVTRVASFGLFADSSAVTFRGEPASLNVAGTACGKDGPQVHVDLPSIKYVR